jgi:hypothetical protein
MKKKATNVKYRKQSETFPDWMKYEITILYEDGHEETVPAYGKDLQDALNRVVHDDFIEKVGKVTNKVPLTIWAILFTVVLGIVSTYLNSIADELGNWVSVAYISSLIIFVSLFLRISNWFRIKNIDKK